MDVGNRFDARKRKGQRSVRSGMSVGVGSRLDARERKGQRCVGSGMHRLDARELKCLGVSRIDRFSLSPIEKGSKRGRDGSRGAEGLARGTRSCT